MNLPAERPVVLTVAGSDSAGMAGLPVDLRVQDALGVHGACAVSANTAQNDGGVLALHRVAAAQLGAQLQAALALRPVVVKAGLLASPGQVGVLCHFVDQTGLPLIYDPVLRSSSGHDLAEEEVLDVMMDQLLPRCALVTPNLEEAGRLNGEVLATAADIEAAARRLAERGAGAVLIKGGHRPGHFAQDYFHSAGKSFWLSSPMREGVQARGTGCALASAIAAALARGHALFDAVVIGKMALNQGLRRAYRPGGATDGKAVLDVDGFPDRGEDLPLLHAQAESDPRRPAFPDCGRDLGLYPVVDRAEWLRRLLPLGIRTAQLRVKDLDGAALAREIRESVMLARDHGCRLFINDHWQQAIEQGAYGVHLGQEDLEGADLTRIREAGLRLGISTHCHYEVAAAHRWRPSYLACGPVYPTTSKRMPWIPHGPAGFGYWRRVLAGEALVAIGGIDSTRIGAIAAAGADGIAMISAITQAPDPEASARELMTAIHDVDSER